jgi:phosphatidylglycerophosphate synthase
VALLPALIATAEATHPIVGVGDIVGRERLLVLMVLLAIGASDVLDGWLARRSGVPPNKRGAVLDAAADRLAQWTGVWYFTLRARTAFTPLPIWLLGALVLRDALLLAIWLRSRKTKAASFEHAVHGKAATVTIFLALLASVSAAPAALVLATALAAGTAVVYSTASYAARLVRAPSGDGVDDESDSSSRLCT